MSYIGIKTAYSFLESTIRIPDLCRVMKEKGHQYVLLTDERLHGSVQFFKHAKQYQLKPILGQIFDVDIGQLQVMFYVTVRHQKGYDMLLKLNQIKLKNTLTLETITKYQDGLNFTLSLHNDTLYDLYRNHSINTVINVIKDLKFKIKSFYVSYPIFMSRSKEMIDTIFDEMRHHTHFILEHHTRYLLPEDRIHYEDLCHIKGMEPEEGDLFILDKDVFNQLSQTLIESQKKFLESHQFDLVFPNFSMPSIPLSEGVIEKEYLMSLSTVGLNKRLKQANRTSQIEQYQKRLQFELDVIAKMGYESYFLIVYDIIKYAKLNHIYVGPGRGSAAGSLVSYCLGITDVDPLEYDLLFERFLNPERISMPDIDMDFPDDKRDLVIQYAYQRFGIDHIASINTYQTFALKSALRDIAKVMNLESTRTNYLSKKIIEGHIDSLDQEMIQLKKRAEAIIGLPRQTGTHPAGMIFSKEPLNEFVPMQEGPYEFYQTQFEASELESLGLLKMDFLGLRNLSIIANAVDEIQQSKPFNIFKIPKDDKKTFALLSEAKTNGIFQLESEGIRHVLKKLKPSNFEDIIAILALYRPGPMAFIDTYIERRHGKPYEPLHPLLKDILASTHGIIVYQEQIMKIAQTFAGYSLAEADLLRRGISKKDESILLLEKDNFIKSATGKGHRKEVATDIYDLIVKFSDYGFNRSHSVAYAFVAYQMAYLKVNYPAQFMVSLLNSVIGDDKHTHEYIKELIQFDIKVIPPNINRSSDKYLFIDGEVIAPLSIIKTIGKKTFEAILEARQYGVFTSFDDFKKRLNKKINNKHVEKLIDAGALDDFTFNHKTLHHHSSMDILDYALYVKDFKYDIKEEFTYDELMNREQAALGFNITYDIKRYFKQFKMSTFEDLKKVNETWIAVQVVRIKKIKTKRDEIMAFLELYDGDFTFEATLFPIVYKNHSDIQEKSFYKGLIKNNEYQGKKTFVIEKIAKLV
ncbi:MAG: DUF655 domain-containing protein [Acholeplasmataceae bacterium]